MGAAVQTLKSRAQMGLMSTEPTRCGEHVGNAGMKRLDAPTDLRRMSSGDLDCDVFLGSPSAFVIRQSMLRLFTRSSEVHHGGDGALYVRLRRKHDPRN